MPFSRSSWLEHSLIQISGVSRRSVAESAFTICIRVARRNTPPLSRRRVFNARGLLWPRSPWAAKGGLFSSRKGPGFLADISRAILSRLDARTIKRRSYLGGYNPRDVCFRDGVKGSARRNLRLEETRQLVIKLMADKINFARDMCNWWSARGRWYCKFPLRDARLTRHNFWKCSANSEERVKIAWFYFAREVRFTTENYAHHN